MKRATFLLIAVWIAGTVSCSDDSKSEDKHECTEEYAGEIGCDYKSDGTCNHGLMCETWRVATDGENIVWQEYDGTCVEERSTDS